MSSNEFAILWRDRCKKLRDPSECAAYHAMESIGTWVEHVDDKVEEHLVAENSIQEQAETLTRNVLTLTASVDKFSLTADELLEKVDLLAKGFPNDDPAGHRMAHEALISAAEARRDFWQKLRFELAKYGLIGFAGWALYALWGAVLHGPAK